MLNQGKMKRYDAILFDFDGVLADTEPIHWEAWKGLLAPVGIDLTLEKWVSHCIGVTDGAMLERLAQLADPPKVLDELWPLYPLKRRRFAELVKAQPPVEAATVDLLKSLAGYRLGVVTSSRRADIEPILQHAGILQLFDVAVYGDDVDRHKPDPMPYTLAVAKLGAQSALVVEDSATGVASATAAGLDVIRVGHAREVPEAVRRALA
jgi:beta-phosphoglucomutase